MWAWPPIRIENKPHVDTPTAAPASISLFTHLLVRVRYRAANSALTIALANQFGAAPAIACGIMTAARSCVATGVVVPLCPTWSSSNDSFATATVSSTLLLMRSNGVVVVSAVNDTSTTIVIGPSTLALLHPPVSPWPSVSLLPPWTSSRQGWCNYPRALLQPSFSLSPLVSLLPPIGVFSSVILLLLLGQHQRVEVLGHHWLKPSDQRDSELVPGSNNCRRLP